MKALSIRQSHAEAIMRGVKPIEYRSLATNVRERICIYASLGRYKPEEEADMMAKYGIVDVACDDLPHGVLIGTVEVWDYTRTDDDFHWYLRNPERATELLKPTKHPQPVWFNPF